LEDVAVDGPIRSTFADDPDMSELVLRFVENLPDRIRKLEASDPADRLRLAHHLRGAAGGYGFPQVSESAGQLEDALRLDRAQDARAALDALAAVCRRIAP
jgi:HPt (histidine-containing phosphotransfer) domain-containing protein